MTTTEQRAEIIKDFAKRLETLMIEKGMSQSDVARKIWGEYTDKNGSVVGRGRDRISAYLAGARLPDPVNLKKLAEALDCDVRKLLDRWPGRPLRRRPRHPAPLELPRDEDKRWLNFEIPFLQYAPPGDDRDYCRIDMRAGTALIEMKMKMPQSLALQILSTIEQLKQAADYWLKVYNSRPGQAELALRIIEMPAAEAMTIISIANKAEKEKEGGTAAGGPRTAAP